MTLENAPAVWCHPVFWFLVKIRGEDAREMQCCALTKTEDMELVSFLEVDSGIT